MDIPLAEDREFAMLDEAQVNTLNALERMGATLSLFGITLIFITFAIFKRLRTIPNTFIFFASIANIGACVACLIAYDGITAMNRDRASPLCQAQGFIFEWFMQSDPWWSFAMAINVWMVFFMSFNPITFRNYLWLYCLICYGLPAIPAFVFLFIRSPRGLIYGDAVLWCWIASEWNSLRIYSYYLPIWVCSVLSAVIYFAVGYHVFHQRNQLRNLSLSNQGKEVTYDSSDVRDSAEKNLTSHHPSPGYYGTVTTEVQVTTAAIPKTPLPAYTNPFRETYFGQTEDFVRDERRDVPDSLEASTSIDPLDPASSPSTFLPVPNAPGTLAPIQAHNYPWSREPSSFSPATDPEAHTLTVGNDNSSVPFSFPAPVAKSHTGSFEATSHGFNTSQYTSISAGSSSPKKDDRGPSPTRLLSPVLKKRSTKDTSTCSDPAEWENRGDSLNIIAKKRKQQPDGGFAGRVSNAARRFGVKLRHMDPVKLAYLRTSFVFAISVLVTWTPSSINRVYTLIYPNKASYGLNIAAAVVLPLQGVWNAVIYFTTSWKIFREEMENTHGGKKLFDFLRLGRTYVDGSESRGSCVLGSLVTTSRSEMGRNMRLDGKRHEGDEMEMEPQSPLSSPTHQRRPQPIRTSTMRVTQKQFEDFS